MELQFWQDENSRSHHLRRMVKCTWLSRCRCYSPRRALVTILEEAPTCMTPALLSEAALAEDWNRAEEDAAWAYFTAGQVVIVHFPFSDLTASKLRPAVVLAEAGRGD